MWNREEPKGTPPRPADAAANRPTTFTRATSIVPLNFGPTIKLKGEVTGQEDLVIAGQMEGTIDLPENALTIAADAKVMAEIHTKEAIVMGSVRGDIIASDRVEIRERGSVEGTIVARRLVLIDGAYFCGRVEMSGT
jgi:cytoskeletal protein CcmA (bactofilin family)